MIFLIIGCLLLIKPLSYGLFIDKVGIDQMPLAFVMIAFVSVGFTFVYSKLITGRDPLSMLKLSFIFSIIVLSSISVVTFFFPAFDLIYYILFVFVSIFGLMTASQFWLSINTIFNKATVKRYFSRLGSSAILGGIAGGYLASLWTLVFSAESLLILVIFLLLMGILLVNKLSKDFLNNNLSKPNRKQLPKELTNESPWKLVWDNRHLRLLGIIIGLSVISAKLIDYEYSYFASINFDSEEELTGFFGFWMANVNFFSLGIQLFLTDKIVGKLGIARSIFILPIALILGVAILLVFPFIMFAVMIKLFDGSLKQTIHKASSELILLPLPQYLKLKTKTFLDVTIDSIATGISGILLYLLVDTLNLSNLWVLFLLFGVLMLWLLFANRVKSEYIKSFRLSLHIKDSAEKNHLSIINTYKNILEKGENGQIIKTLGKLKTLQISQLELSLIKLLNHPESRVVIKAIERLNELKKDHGLEILELTNHPKSSVRLAALRYLMVHNKSLDVNYFIDKINAKDYVTKTTSILALAIEYRNQPETLRLIQIQKRIEEILNHVEKSNNENLKKEILPAIFRIIAYARLEDYYNLINNYIYEDEPYQSQAMLSLGIIKDPKYIDTILDIMEEDESTMEIGREALSIFGFEYLSEYILDLLKERNIKRLHFFPEVLINFPVMYSIKVLIKLSETSDKNLTRKAISAISEIINDDPLVPVDNRKINKILINEIEYFQDLMNSFESLSHSVKQTDEKTYFFRKIKAIYQSIIDKQLETLFKLLNIKYPPEELESLYPLFKGRQNETRTNAIEYLENLLTPNIKDHLLPILEAELVFTEPIDHNVTFDVDEFYSSIAKIENKELKARLSSFFENEIRHKIN